MNKYRIKVRHLKEGFWQSKSFPETELKAAIDIVESLYTDDAKYLRLSGENNTETCMSIDIIKKCIITIELSND